MTDADLLAAAGRLATTIFHPVGTFSFSFMRIYFDSIAVMSMGGSMWWNEGWEGSRSGTCKMGRSSDPSSVVDAELRVIGVEVRLLSFFFGLAHCPA